MLIKNNLNIEHWLYLHRLQLLYCIIYSVVGPQSVPFTLSGNIRRNQWSPSGTQHSSTKVTKIKPQQLGKEKLPLESQPTKLSKTHEVSIKPNPTLCKKSD